jgi:hypothetical protein
MVGFAVTARFMLLDFPGRGTPRIGSHQPGCEYAGECRGATGGSDPFEKSATLGRMMLFHDVLQRFRFAFTECAPALVRQAEILPFHRQKLLPQCRNSPVKFRCFGLAEIVKKTAQPWLDKALKKSQLY